MPPPSNTYRCCGQGYTRRSSLSWAIPILYHCFTRRKWVNSSLNELQLHQSYPVQIIQLFLNTAGEHEYQDFMQHKMGEEQTNSAEEGYPLLFHPFHQYHLLLPPGKIQFKAFPVSPTFPGSQWRNQPSANILLLHTHTPPFSHELSVRNIPTGTASKLPNCYHYCGSQHRLGTKKKNTQTSTTTHPRWL